MDDPIPREMDPPHESHVPADSPEDSSDIDIDTPLAVRSSLSEASFDHSAIRNREDLKRLFNSTCISYYKRRRVFSVCSSHPLLTSSFSSFSNCIKSMLASVKTLSHAVLSKRMAAASSVMLSFFRSSFSL